jgi:ATP-independent RNA helicase DbpA
MKIKEILENMKIASLKPMQKEAFDVISMKKDVILLSPTGSGKTLAFLLPILDRIDTKTKGVQVLILVPSRELAIQIEQVFKSMQTGIKINSCYGGHAMKVERNNFSHPPSVLVGTPGRIVDHITREHFATENIHTIILDEYDKSLELGFKDEMSFIISKAPSIKQRILTSATELKEIPTFTGVKDPETVNYLSDFKAPNLVLRIVRAEESDKLDILYRLLCTIGEESSLVFCNHREAVERISTHLRDLDIAHDVFHGGLEQSERELALLKFRNGSIRTLITTDLAARGLDIPEIENVIHYQVSATEDAYIHRTGRTARMNASGKAFIVLGERENIPKYIKLIPPEEYIPLDVQAPYNPQWVTLYLAGGKKDKINKIDIVGLFCKTGGLSKDEIGIIEVKDFTSFVAVKRNSVKNLLRKLQDQRIKRKKVKIDIAY